MQYAGGTGDGSESGNWGLLLGTYRDSRAHGERPVRDAEPGSGLGRSVLDTRRRGGRAWVRSWQIDIGHTNATAGHTLGPVTFGERYATS